MRDRNERARQTLRDAAAQFLAREAGPQSLITITRAEITSNFSRATLHISVLPEEKAPAALGLLKRNVQELKRYLEENARLPRMPHIEFELERPEAGL